VACTARRTWQVARGDTASQAPAYVFGMTHACTFIQILMALAGPNNGSPPFSQPRYIA